MGDQDSNMGLAGRVEDRMVAGDKAQMDFLREVEIEVAEVASEAIVVEVLGTGLRMVCHRNQLETEQEPNRIHLLQV